jgi:ubiquinone/menaquinone biosynthesis C-methylase UbiE
LERKEVKTLIAQARRAFDAELHTKAYRETHADYAQLNRLLSFLPENNSLVFLDLGTGDGYVAMELAQRHSSSIVIGVDIAEKAIRKNIEVAVGLDMSNIWFQSFDGVTLPFESNFFDGIFCRYAFHHFPVPKTTLKEIRRTLRKSGQFIYSDAVRSEVDDTDFINRFQELKEDGHVSMLTISDTLKRFEKNGFLLKDSFTSSITFDRPYKGRNGKLIDTTPEKTLRAYDVSSEGDKIRLSFEIFNGVFESAA